MPRKSICPQCQETLVHANIGNGKVDVYCEDCGYPDENREPTPECVICKQPGVGTCGDTWRCEDHWQEQQQDKWMMFFSWESAIREAKRINKSGGNVTLKKKWYGWIVIDSPIPRASKADRASTLRQLTKST